MSTAIPPPTPPAMAPIGRVELDFSGVDPATGTGTDVDVDEEVADADARELVWKS